jgi:hypothetical protein
MSLLTVISEVVFIQNVLHKMQHNTVNHLFLRFPRYQECDNVQQQYVLKMSPTFLKIGIQPFHSVFCIYSKIFFITVSYGLFNFRFNVLQTSRITAVDSFFNKSPQKEVMCCKVWESEAKCHAQQCDNQRSPARKWLLFSQYEQSAPSCWNSSTIYSCPAQLRQKNWIIFHSNCLFKEQESHN